MIADRTHGPRLEIETRMFKLPGRFPSPAGRQMAFPVFGQEDKKQVIILCCVPPLCLDPPVTRTYGVCVCVCVCVDGWVCVVKVM